MIVLEDVLAKQYSLGEDLIWRPVHEFLSQENELNKRRELVRNKLNQSKAELMISAARHYSIPVMHHEVRRFLKLLPPDAIVLDIGGGVGWHWLELEKIRPDVRVILIDFLWENLYRTKALFPLDQFNKRIFLVNGNALDLKLPDGLADGYWSVQCLQHIPDYAGAVVEAYRVLKTGGVFFNYSLNNQWLIRWIYRLFGKNYPVKSHEERYYIARACPEQREIVEATFGNPVQERLSEILFSPELYFTVPGREHSILGTIDAFLSNNLGMFSAIARQRSYEVTRS